MTLAGASHKCPNPLRNNDFEKLRERHTPRERCKSGLLKSLHVCFIDYNDTMRVYNIVY